MKNLLTRTLTGILFIVIITTAVLSGAYTFLFIFGIISLLGYIEFINLTQFGRKFDKILLMLDMAGACALFLAVFSLPVSSAVRCRVLCRKTIGAGTRVRLGFPNARPVVSDELARSSAGQ